MSTGQPNRPKRQTLRLRHHDYSAPGAYFVTICTHRHKCICGSIPNTAFEPNSLGEIVTQSWAELPDHYPNLQLDVFVVMPNHIHGLIFLTETSPRRPLSEIVRGFKTFSAKHINQHQDTPGSPVWQRGFHEHIVRNDDSLDKIRRYIETNPARWAIDRENPAFMRAGHRPAPTGNGGTAPLRAGHRPAPTGNTGAVGAGFKPARNTNDDVVGAGFKLARNPGRRP
ncbi:MAG: transposase [Proteobacteria bacterium]|nr:transposase [Pseudomonadota bacterium]